MSEICSWTSAITKFVVITVFATKISIIIFSKIIILRHTRARAYARAAMIVNIN